MSDGYSTYKFAKHTALTVILGTILVYLANIGVELGVVDQGLETMMELAAWALVVYAFLPLVEAVFPTLQSAKEVYANWKASAE